MNTGLLDVLHDAGDLDLMAVGDGVDIDLDGVLQIAVDQDRAGARHDHRAADIAVEPGMVVDDLHRPAAQHIGRADHHRVADALGDRLGLLGGIGGAVIRLAQPEPVQELLEALTVLGQVDRIGRGAEDRDVGRLERLGEVQWGLPAELDDDPEQVAAPGLDADDLDHVLGGQRLEIEPVGGVVIGRHGLRVAVDHDRLDTGLAQRVGGMDAAIIELDPLADAVRASPPRMTTLSPRSLGSASHSGGLQRRRPL